MLCCVVPLRRRWFPLEADGLPGSVELTVRTPAHVAACQHAFNHISGISAASREGVYESPQQLLLLLELAD